MRKFFRIFEVFVLLSSLSLQAEETPEESRYSYTLSSTVLSKYYGSIVGGIFYNRPIIFNDLNISRSDKQGSTYIDFWMSRPITKGGWNQDGGDEYDLIIGRTLGLAKNSQGNARIALDVAGVYLAVHPLTQMNSHVFTVNIRADLPTVKYVQPYVNLYYFGKTGQNSPPSGEFFYGGLQRNQPTKLSINDRKVLAQLDYRFGYSGGALGADWGPAYNRLSVAVVLPLTEKVQLVLAIIGQIPFQRNDPLEALGDHRRVFYTLTMNYHWGK